MEQINANVQGRSGIKLPIEDRMIGSISSMLAAVGFELDDLKKVDKNWGGKNLYQKCEAIGWDQVYLTMFAGMSGSVHGSWTDLQTHHLIARSPFEFEGATEWSRPRPQPIFALSRVVAQASVEIFSIFQWEEVETEFLSRIEDFFERVDHASDMHETFLQRNIAGK